MGPHYAILSQKKGHQVIKSDTFTEMGLRLPGSGFSVEMRYFRKTQARLHYSAKLTQNSVPTMSSAPPFFRSLNRAWRCLFRDSATELVFEKSALLATELVPAHFLRKYRILTENHGPATELANRAWF